MDKQFEKIPSTQHAINLLLKFEMLNLPGLPIQEKYQRILSHYGKDIEMVSKIYQKNKNEPPVARDLPPIAGKRYNWFLATTKLKKSGVAKILKTEKKMCPNLIKQNE